MWHGSPSIIRVLLYSTLSPSLTLDGVDDQQHDPTALPLGKTFGTHCTGGWLGTKASLDGHRKSRPHRDSIPELSSP